MVDCGFDVGWSHLVAVDFSNRVPADVLDAAFGCAAADLAQLKRLMASA